MPVSTQGFGMLFDYDSAVLPPNKVIPIPPVKLHISGEISDQKSPQYNSQPIIGRSTPLVGYNSTGERIISFTAIMVEDPRREKVPLRQRMRYLKSYLYPDYTNSAFINPPKRCRFIYGGDIGITGVMTECSVSWRTETRIGNVEDITSQNRVDAKEKLSFEFYRNSLYATVNISIQEAREVDILDYVAIADKGDADVTFTPEVFPQAT